MKRFLQHKNVLTIWKITKPWLFFAAILLVFHFTGVLASLNVLTNRALLETRTMDASAQVGDYSAEEKFDYNFSIFKLDGTETDVNTFKGKTIFINLWATWCGPCKAEMPSIESLYQKKKDNDKIVFIILSLDRASSLPRVKNYISSNEFKFPVYTATQLPALLNVGSIPTTFVISPSGSISYKHVGMANYDNKKFIQLLDDTATSQH